MKKKLLGIILAATLVISGVPVLAADSEDTAATVEQTETAAEEELSNDTVSEKQEELSFDAALEELYDRSMSITDEEILSVANQMQSDFSVIEDRSDAAVLIGIIKSFEAEKAQFILGSESCSYNEAVRSEWQRQKYYTEFELGSEYALKELLPRIQIRNVSESDSGLELDIFEWNTEGYSTGDGIVSAGAYGYNFTLQLTNSDGVWKAAAVSNTDSNYEELTAEGVHITSDGVTCEESAGESDEEVVGASDYEKIYFTYDVDAAVAYADKWAMSYNPEYENYKDDGGDCANFVSQCLFAGGMPINAYWNPSASYGSAWVAWVNNNSLRNYLVNHGIGTYVKDPSESQISTGDLIYYNWSGGKTTTNHVTICVGRNSSGVPIIDSHTTAKYHSPWKYGGSSTYYSAVLMNQDTSNSSVRNVYRLYNPNSGEHFYTLSSVERANLTKIGWKDEGIGWYAPQTSSQPVYRLYNRNAGDHHYTISTAERDNLVKLGWTYEGILCYSDTNKTMPLYRQFNPNAKTGSHNFSITTTERDILVKAGWRDEGIAWYGVKKS